MSGRGIGGPREGSNSWQAMARMMSGASSTTSSVKSEPLSATGANKRRNADDEDILNIDTSDTGRFAPPKKTREQAIADKRNPLTGWVIKGRTEDGTGGVNVIKKDERLIDLALEGKATLEAQLRICSKPVIGLNHVVEYIDPDAEGTVRVYYCQLCAVFRTAATALDHIISYHHRVRTLRKAFPADSNMFLCQDKKTINRNPGLMDIATRRANEYELVYGRGEVDVRHERPVMPENDGEEESDQLVLVDTKQLEYLELTLKEMKTLQIKTADEMRVASAICTYLTDQICEFRVSNPNA